MAPPRPTTTPPHVTTTSMTILSCLCLVVTHAHFFQVPLPPDPNPCIVLATNFSIKFEAVNRSNGTKVAEVTHDTDESILAVGGCGVTSSAGGQTVPINNPTLIMEFDTFSYWFLFGREESAANAEDGDTDSDNSKAYLTRFARFQPSKVFGSSAFTNDTISFTFDLPGKATYTGSDQQSYLCRTPRRAVHTAEDVYPGDYIFGVVMTLDGIHAQGYNVPMGGKFSDAHICDRDPSTPSPPTTTPSGPTGIPTGTSGTHDDSDKTLYIALGAAGGAVLVIVVIIVIVVLVRKRSKRAQYNPM